MYFECCSTTQHTQCTEICRYFSPDLRFYTLYQDRCQFQILDPSTGCHESITTINTPWGPYCFLKLPFRLCESQYFFQFYMDLNFKAINKGTHIIANDVVLVGNDSSTSEGHDCHLVQVLNKCREIGLKLNPDKCIFKLMQVLFFGHLVTKEGLKPDPKKVNAIANMPAPQNKTQLQSFVRLCNYLSCYVPHLTDVLLHLEP